MDNMLDGKVWSYHLYGIIIDSIYTVKEWNVHHDEIAAQITLVHLRANYSGASAPGNASWCSGRLKRLSLLVAQPSKKEESPQEKLWNIGIFCAISA